MQLLNEGNPSTSPTEKWQVQDTRYARHVCKAVQSVREEPYIGRVYVGKVPAAAAAKSLQSCPTLCDPRDGCPLGSSVPGILQARTLVWVAISFSNAWEWKVKVKLLSCVRLCDPMDCSPPSSSTHGILQARVLEWGAIAFSSGEGEKQLMSENYPWDSRNMQRSYLWSQIRAFTQLNVPPRCFCSSIIYS